MSAIIALIFSSFVFADPPTPPPFGDDADDDGIPNEQDKCSNTIDDQIVYGCSCTQILELKPGKDKSCNKGIITMFTKKVGWAKDFFE